MKRILVTFLCVACMNSVYALDFSALLLYNNCLREIDSDANKSITVGEEFQAGFCLGFVKGLDDMLYLYYEKVKTKTRKVWLYCLPKGEPLKKMIDAYVSYMKKHPEKNNEEAGKVLIAALMDKYPCH